jgi:zinc protease
MRAAYLACLLLLVCPTVGSGQDLSAPLPLDPSIRAGTLPNGLRFFIRRNERPDDRAFLRLAVKAGSVDEADDQRGLAHVLEHMAFNGTAHFKPGELVAYLESIGAQFGPHVNAYTSFDETVYMLNVPTDRSGVLTRGFEALSDFAGGISLIPAEIERERGVVIEEWRGRLGASERMQEPQIRAMFGMSRYADRLPIGTPESLKTFTPERLRAFYDDHYRPDRMAVIVAGDIDPEEIEKQIAQHFGGLKARGNTTRATHAIPPHQDTRYVSVSDREAQASTVSIMVKRPLRELRTLGDYRRSIVESLMSQMVNARFAEISRQPDAPFLAASVGGDTLGRTVEAFSAGARTQDGALERGLTALAQELARVRQHGFGAAELDRAKRSMLAQYERLYNERDKAESAPLADELVRHFLVNEAAPGIEAELNYVKGFLATITAGEVAALAREYITEANRVVIASAPERTGVTKMTEAALGAALRAGTSAPVTPWDDGVAGRELLAKAPTPGSVRARREIPEVGVTVLTLSNGVEVWLKPTDFRNDQISFTSYARGGLTLAPADDFTNAALATGLVGLAGVGGLNPIDLGKLLAGKIAGASPYVSTATHGMTGSATPRDLETSMQLLYLNFTAPNRDLSAFELMKQRLQALLANQAQNPGSVYGERLQCINTSNHYTCKTPKPEDIAKLNPDRMWGFYQQLFANAADFTFFFVGAFKVEEVTPLLEKYIASLPSKGTPTARLGDLRLQFPSASVREVVYKGQEPRSQTAMTFFADTGQQEFESHRAGAGARVLENRLRDILREQLGGTYSVSAGYSDIAPIPGYGSISVRFGSSPENVEKLQAAVMAEVDRLRREGPSASDVQAVKEAEKNQLQESFKQNGYWLNSLQTVHLLGRDARSIPARMQRADSLTQENIHAAIRKYLPADRYTIVSLMPEAK